MAARLDRIYEHAKYEHQWKHTTIVNILNVAYDRNTAWKVFFWSVFSCIRTEYGDLWSKFPYSVRIQESGPEKLRIWALFTQWKRKGLKFHPKWLRHLVEVIDILSVIKLNVRSCLKPIRELRQKDYHEIILKN